MDEELIFFLLISIIADLWSEQRKRNWQKKKRKRSTKQRYRYST